MWLGILIGVLAATAVGAVYLTVAVGRFGLLRRLSGGNSRLNALLSFTLLAAAFTAAALAMSVVNAIIVFLTALLFFLLFGLAGRLASAAGLRRAVVNWPGWLALLSTAAYLAAGHFLLCSVRPAQYALTTEKAAAPFRIAVIADAHLGTTFDGEGFARYIDEIRERSPDIVLIPGDFVDDGTARADMERACEALGGLDAPYGVWFAFGNHDPGYYGSRDFGAGELSAALEQNGVGVLEDEAVSVGGRIAVVGRKDAYTEDRQPIAALTEGLDRGLYVIVMDHQPSDYDNEAAAGVDLVVSGHTHGGQLFPATYLGEWIGANDRTYGHERRLGTDFIVTSGISDWEIQFKTGTRSEYVIIDVEPDR